jgi:hypothetical protein
VDELVLQAAGSLSLPNFQLLTVSAAALVYSNSRSQLFAVQVFSAPYDTSPCAVGVQMWSLPTFQSVEFVPLDAEQVCVFDDVTALGAINSMSVQALEVTADIQTRAGLADCAPGNFLVTASFDQFDPASNTSFVYSAVLCLDVDTLALSRSPIDSIHRKLVLHGHSATRAGIMRSAANASTACIASGEHADAPEAASAAFQRSPHRAADYARWACHTTRAARQPSASQRPRIESSAAAATDPPSSSTFKATRPRTMPAGGTASAFPAVGTFLGRESIVALVDVGAVPSVSLLATPSGSAFVVSIHQDGDASCAADTHTDADADADTAACDRAPRNSPFALGFNFASLGLWIQQLRSGRLFSSCSADQVFHGVYDFGSAPSVALFPVSQSDNNSTVGLLAFHNGMPSNLTAASSPRAPLRSSACGSALRFNGIVLDRFRLWPSADTPRAAPSAAAPIFLWLILGSVSCAALIAFIVVSFVRANRPPHELAIDSAADEHTRIQGSATLRDYSQL